MSKKQNTYLTLDPEAKKAAQMAAAQAGLTLSEYMARIVIVDAKKRGLLQLVEPPQAEGVDDGE